MKKKVSKLFALVLCLTLVMSLAACGSSDDSSSDETEAAETEAAETEAEETESTASDIDYPTSVIRFIVNYSAGGGTDLSARALADAAATALGGTLTVDNVSGGTGSVGVQELANSDNDGYTVGVATLAPLAIVPWQLDVSYTPDSFEYICAFGQYGYGIVVAADSPYETLDDLLDAAREAPVKFGATGYPQPITMRDLGDETGAQFEFVSYSETTDLVTDVLGGFIPCAMADMASFASYVEAGDMRLLASAHSQRWDVAPDVETLGEMGYSAIADSYMGVCVPAGTPSEIVEILRDAFAEAVDDPTFIEIMGNAHQAVAYMDGDEYEAMVREYYDFYSTFDFESAN